MFGLVSPDSLFPRPGEGRRWPLSYQQETNYVSGLLYPEMLFGPRNVLFLVLRLRGPLDAFRMQGALDDVVARHSVLRTRFVVAEDSTPLQEELASARRLLVLREAQGEPLEVLIQALGEAPVALQDLPPLRVELVRVGPDDHLLGVSVHHLVSDATGLVLLVEDLARAYEARGQGERLAPLAFGYGDYALWHRAATATRLPGDIAVALAEMKGCVPAPLRPEMPFSPAAPGAPAVVRCQLLDPAAVAAARRFALRQRSSLSVLLLTVFELALRERWSVLDHVVLAFFDQRDHPATRQMVGNFLCPALIRFPLPADRSLCDALQDLTRRVLRASDRAYIPALYLLAAAPEVLGHLSGARSPGFMSLQLQTRADPPLLHFGEAVGGSVGGGIGGLDSPLPVLIAVPMADGALDLEVHYRRGHFTQTSMRRLIGKSGELLLAWMAEGGALTPVELLARTGEG